MKNYPDLSQVAKADHLLFDLGYSYALLHNVQRLLRLVEHTVHSPTLRMEISEVLEAIQSLQEGRLQIRSEIYDNAAAAAEKGTSK